MLKAELIQKILEDLQAGLGDIPVLEKYQISPDTLIGIKTKYLRKTFSKTPCGSIGKDKRQTRRCYPLFNIKVHEIPQTADIGASKNIGTINDISKKGIQLLGIKAVPGVIKVFAVMGDRSGAFRPFIFSGTCQWSEETVDGLVTGYAMTLLSAEDKIQADRFLENMTLS